MTSCKRSLSDTSSEDEEEKKTSTIPKKRNWNTDVHNVKIRKDLSSDEDNGRPSFNAHLKKGKCTSDWNTPQKNLSSDEDNGRPSFNAHPKKRKYTGDWDESKKRFRSAASDGDGGEKNYDTPNKKKILPTNQDKGNKSKPVYNDVAKKMMEKMGFKEGRGLGRLGQGRTEIIETSKQRGRRGLGLHIKGLEPSTNQWDFDKEHVSIDEEVAWIPECDDPPLLISEMRRWVKEGEKKKTIDDETEFCDEEILKEVLALKSVFDNLEPEEMRRARTKSNPFETIRGVMFQNRAAMKMANMDAVFDFMFTEPVDEFGKTVIGPQDLLFFADICAGPGGFSEYILFRKRWHAKGFGFTLRGANDFKLEEFFAGPPESFEPHYGVHGQEGDGDIYNPENLREFRRFVLERTEGKGIHFVMADGGFSVEGEENLQEILSKRLYLCQFLCALSILRTGGHFVCKVFDLFTPFSVGLIYLLYRAFRKVCIHKPVTSRPANSERYVVCKWKLESAKDIHDYMFEVNCRLEKIFHPDSTTDIIEVVPLNLLMSHQTFYDYIRESNNKLGEWQVISLAKIQAFAQNSELHEERQSNIRKECLELWKIPDKARSAPNRTDPASKFLDLMRTENTDYMSYKAEELELEKLKSIQSIYDYRCLVSGVENTKKPDRGFILGMGRTHIFKWDGTCGSRWMKLELALELPADTLLYAEVINELRGEGRAMRKISALHVIDALFLGGEDIRSKHFTERVILTRQLLHAVSKYNRTDYAPVRMKEVFRFESIEQVFDRLDMKHMKGGGNPKRLCFNVDKDDYHFFPTGLILIKTVEDPWTIAMSKSANRKYYFNTKTRASDYSSPPDALANFRSCFTKRIFWAWESGVQLLPNHNADECRIHKDTILKFVANRRS